MEGFVHASLDLYAFIAITASSATLEELREMVQKDNDTRQRELDTEGELLPRALDVSCPVYARLCPSMPRDIFSSSSGYLVLSTPNMSLLHFTLNTSSRAVAYSQSMVLEEAARTTYQQRTGVSASHRIPTAQPSPNSITLVRNKSSIHFW